MKKSACMVKLGLLLLLALAFSLATGLERQQQRISDSLVRLHVVGSSNDRRDQDIKLLVRDAVLQESGEILAGAGDRADAMALLGENLSRLEAVANDVLREQGTGDRAQVTLRRELFGTRFYDTFTLPGGYYEALRVKIGAAEGKNWWCVVYPQLCMSAAAAPEAVPAMGGMAPEDARLISQGEISFRFRCLELLEDLLGYFRARGEGIPTSE